MFIPKPKTDDPQIAGVAFKSYADDEFQAMSDEYDTHFAPEQKGSLLRWFDHIDDQANATGGTAGAGRKS